MSDAPLFILLRFQFRQVVCETQGTPTVAGLTALADCHYGSKIWRFHVNQDGYQTQLESDNDISLAIRSGILCGPRMIITAEEELNPELDNPVPWHLRGPFS